MSENKQVSVIIKALDETLPGFKSARHHVGEFANEAKKLIAEAFVGFTAFEFFKTAIEKATEAEQSYVQLSNTLANVGVNYEHNREKIEETIKSLQKVANVRTDDAIKGLNTLVQRSGDYNGSLKQMVLVADLAKAKHLEFNEAAELVGRVMGGNTRVLKQFGIVTKDAHDGLKQLTERLHGAAAADMLTFGGQVEALKIKFFNLAEQVGDVLTGNATLGDSFKSVGDWLVALTKHIDKNAAEYGLWFTVIVAGVRETARAFTDLITIAFQTGTMIGKVLNLSWGNPGDKEKRQQLFKEIAEANTKGTKAISDLSQGFDRFGDAVALAHQKAEASIHRTDSELARSAAANAARLAARAKAEEDARAKKAEAEERERNKKIDDQVAMLGKAANLREFRDRAYREQAIAGLNLMESLARRELAGLDNTNASLHRRLVLEDRLAKIVEEKKKAGLAPEGQHLTDVLEANQPKGPTGVDVLGNPIQTAGERLAQITHDFKNFKVDLSTVPHLGFLDALDSAFERNNKHLMDASGHVDQLANSLGEIVAGPLQQFGEASAMAFGAMIMGSQSAGAMFRNAMLSAISAVAKHKGDFFAAEIPEALAIHDYWAAGRHLAAATAMYAVAGAAGAASTGGGGGGGGSGQSPYGTLSNSNQSQGAVTVVLTGKSSLFDLTDPQTQDEFSAMLAKLSGNRQINYTVGR